MSWCFASGKQKASFPLHHASMTCKSGFFLRFHGPRKISILTAFSLLLTLMVMMALIFCFMPLHALEGEVARSPNRLLLSSISPGGTGRGLLSRQPLLVSVGSNFIEKERRRGGIAAQSQLPDGEVWESSHESNALDDDERPSVGTVLRHKEEKKTHVSRSSSEADDAAITRRFISNALIQTVKERLRKSISTADSGMQIFGRGQDDKKDATLLNSHPHVRDGQPRIRVHVHP